MRTNDLLAHFNARREVCEMCSHEIATRKITYPLDIVMGDSCFFQYQRDLPIGAQLEVTVIDRRPIYISIST